MDHASPDHEFRRRMERLESRLREVDALPESPVRVQVREIVQAVLDLHATGLEHMLDRIAGSTLTGVALIEHMAHDDIVGSLLALHGLHPFDYETRVRQALDKVRPYLQSHGGSVELLAVSDGVVRLRMAGTCHGCPSSALTLKNAIEAAIYDLAPEVSAIEVEGVAEPASAPLSVIVPLTDLRTPNRASDAVRVT
jgi:Fe-S cluster biogenesis protein NfuA